MSPASSGCPERLQEAAPEGVGKNAEVLVGSERILASVCEAVIGATYLAFGIERVKPAVVEAFADQLDEALESPVDFKSLLQETLARHSEVVNYRIVEASGPAHDRSFTADRRGGRRGGRPRRGQDQEGRRAGGRVAGARPRRRALAGAGERLMHLRSISVKGFKSFPDRERLDFAPGVSVIVGPNGSGKSNITDAVLWALGEQSPLAVRGQTMQDVIFAGGHGIPSRNAAEVEVVIDNSDGGLQTEFSEISITRRLDRSGEGEYRLNGARCRLVDVVEVLSDTGLGKEMHSVVSQGRVEAIVHSKPKDRRLLIEEAAGLGKHRKRRRRAQLKLERTQDNIARALDVEREARSRLRPLKRQAEAAELHARLERQSLEARLELSRDAAGIAGRELEAAEAAAQAAGAERDEAERVLAAIAARREAVEEAFAAASRHREALAGRVFAARSSHDRIGMREERARDLAKRSGASAAQADAEREALAEQDAAEPEAPEAAGRVAELESELGGIEAQLSRALDEELSELDAERSPRRGPRGRAGRDRDPAPRGPRRRRARRRRRAPRARGGRPRGRGRAPPRRRGRCGAGLGQPLPVGRGGAGGGAVARGGPRRVAGAGARGGGGSRAAARRRGGQLVRRGGRGARRGTWGRGIGASERCRDRGSRSCSRIPRRRARTSRARGRSP